MAVLFHEIHNADRFTQRPGLLVGTVRCSKCLEDIRDRLSWAEIRLQLVNQERVHGHGKMPDFSHLSDAEIDALIYFIKPVQ